MGEHRRFFVEPECVSDASVEISGGAARQITKVLRLGAGDCIWVLDGSGCEYEAKILRLSKDAVSAGILGKRTCPNEPAVRLTLAVCMPKSDKIELIVQKGAEVGISELVIVDSERTVARPDGPKIAGRMARWRRIAREAAEQCGRGKVPGIRGVVTFDELAEEIRRSPLTLVAWEDENRVTLKDALRSGGEVESLMFVVGPEGGLAEAEVETAKAAGAKCVSLGKRTMRCETAAIAGCAAILYELEL